MAANVATPKRAATVERASGSISTTRIEPASCPRAIRPPTRARAMLPPPMMLMFILAFSVRARTEQGRAHAHHGRALRDRRLEIARHPDRERIGREPVDAACYVDLAQDAKLPALSFDVFGLLGDAHEAAKLQSR